MFNHISHVFLDVNIYNRKCDVFHRVYHSHQISAYIWSSYPLGLTKWRILRGGTFLKAYTKLNVPLNRAFKAQWIQINIRPFNEYLLFDSYRCVMLIHIGDRRKLWITWRDSLDLFSNGMLYGEGWKMLGPSKQTLCHDEL